MVIMVRAVSCFSMDSKTGFRRSSADSTDSSAGTIGLEMKTMQGNPLINDNNDSDSDRVVFV